MENLIGQSCCFLPHDLFWREVETNADKVLFILLLCTRISVVNVMDGIFHVSLLSVLVHVMVKFFCAFSSFKIELSMKYFCQT